MSGADRRSRGSSPLRVATRGSPLARWQADAVVTALDAEVETVIVETTGDRRRDLSLSALGGQGVFVKEVQSAVLEGRADFAVHSAKDLPSGPADGLVIAAVPERGDPRDGLVGATLQGLPTGGRVATGSVRRRAQLAHARPDLTFADLRGNIGTRLDKAAQYHAVVIACAALRRLGQAERIAEALDPSWFVPQVAQGALAVECRADDDELIETLCAIEDGPSRRAVDAERAFLAELGGGCSIPAAAHAVPDRSDPESDQLVLTGLLATADGAVLIRHSATSSEPVSLGREVALHLLDRCGGRALLASS